MTTHLARRPRRCGDPATEILDTADEVDADLIALAGRRKRSPAGKALFGSTTQAVILETDRSVLVAGTPDEDGTGVD